MNSPLKTLLPLALAAFLVAGCSLTAEQEAPAPREDNVAQAPPAAAQEVPEDEPVAQVASQVEPSVVQVNVQAIQQTPFGAQEQEGLGSGVIYRSDGYIVTNNHVVEGADEVNIAFADGTVERGEVVGTDPTTDLAVVQVNRTDLPAASFVEGDDLIPGQLAVAIGSPSGFQSTVTSGVISGLNREIPPEFTLGQQEEPLVDLVQTDAAISPGNSGGALANRDGEVVGINVAYLPSAQTGAVDLGFAIPSDTVISIADQLIETGEASQPFIGVSLDDITAETAEQFGREVVSGALVIGVEPGSGADAAGVQEGDIIVGLNDDLIEDAGDLLGALREYQPGDEVDLTVVRNGSEQTLPVTLGERT